MRSSKKQNYILYTQIALIALCLFIVFKPTSTNKVTIETSKPKTIIKNIKGKETEILKRETVIKFDEAEVDRLNGSILNLQEQLTMFKRGKDTIQIIHTQDKLIDSLVFQGQEKDTIIGNLKLNIKDLKYINNSKDTLLAIKDNKIKKIKRQRNLSFIANGLLATLLIIK
jgi:hypothetical protein